MSDFTIKKPVIIIGSPRSGTSLLFRILSTSSNLLSLYRESHDIWNGFYRFINKEYKNDLLDENDLNEKSKSFLLNEFHKHTLNNYYIGYVIREYLLKKELLKPSVGLIASINLMYKNLFLNEYRIVEKTPINCFRIAFLNKLFNDCIFIFLKRDGRANINSLIEGWKHPKRYIRPEVNNISLNIKGYKGKHWKFVLPPGWENYTNRPLEEVCAFQWISSNQAALEGLAKIREEKKYIISNEDLTENTYETIKKLCYFIKIPFSRKLREISKDPPLVNTVSKPDKNKWKKNEDLIKRTYSMIEPMMKELGYSLKD